VPLTGHLWPLATHHRGHPSGPTGGGGAYGQSGSLTLATPLGAPLRGHSPLWPSGEALHREGAAHRPYWGAGHSLAKRGAPLTAPPGRRPFADWPPLATASPTGHLCHRLPHWPEKRTAPIGKRGATPSPASHWPPTGHLLAIRGGPHWPKGRPRLATGRGEPSPGPPPDWPKGREGGPMATRELQPPTSRPPMAKGEPHHPLATKGRP